MPQRHRDPWVMRSVLDQHIRMVTLAFHQDAYAAYSTEKCVPYKWWKGGVHWDGAAFNNTKTIQPETWGPAYHTFDLDKNPWSLQQHGKKTPIQPQYKGYFLQNNQLTFQYIISLENAGQISVFEQPDVVFSKSGKVSFTQEFRLENVPPDVLIFYGDQELPAKIQAEFDILPDQPAPERLFTDNQALLWLDKSGCNTCHEADEKTVGPGYRQIADAYDEDTEALTKLIQKVRSGGSGVWGPAAMPSHPGLAENDLKTMIRYVLSLQNKPDQQASKIKSPQSNNTPEVLPTPGFGAPVAGLHPALDLHPIRPQSFKPRVGGLDFLPDGSLLVTTWDSIGAVYRLQGIASGDTNQVRITRMASGLAEPLGLKVVDGEVYVLQKQELTQLIDHDTDGVADEYRAICNSFDASADFHEFSYGLVYKDGYFYAALGLAMRLMQHEEQLQDRGTLIKISKDGTYEQVISGLRQNNGIGLGPEGGIFLTENQGNWVPACKVIHVQPGAFHGCLMNTGRRYDGHVMSQPALWLPQDEIGNSPSQPVLIPQGPYAGQMLHGEVTHGGIKRVFLEKINGNWQGCVFRFTQGLEAGINRLVFGPDGALYAGGVGMNGNWAWNNAQYGLQRLTFNGKTAFEILAVRMISGGAEIEFTQPLAAGLGEKASDYSFQQWRYEPTAAYGGPKLDLGNLTVSGINLSPDRKKARLRIPGKKPDYVLYIRLNEGLKSAGGDALWSGEAWYTMNAVE